MTSLNQQNHALSPVNITEVSPAQVPSSLLDPVLVKLLVEHTSPIVFLLLLCWFFRIMTRFIEVCKEE